MVRPSAKSKFQIAVFTLFTGHLIKKLTGVEWSGICVENVFPVCWNYSLGCICSLVKSLRHGMGERIRREVSAFNESSFFLYQLVYMPLGIVGLRLKNQH